ncbi:class I SAM-dependent methyltransferase [Cellulomonas telluris]|uniref:methyltransferase domain-containing protein n=1 Tax=Cellulomonas telluris TaxID=2306636 RepID=UPI0010A7EEE8|nr:class I SAM-dependent methyltransferase [Cellulomonas telluris]
MDRHSAAALLVTGLTDGSVLELGSGPRGLAPLLAGRVRRYEALDRSPRATAALTTWLAEHHPDGAWGVRTGDLTDLPGQADLPPADVVVAVNVNAFWTGATADALAAVGGHLRPGGALVLVLETPDPVDARVRPALHAALADAGWRWQEHPEAGGPRGVALVARPVA